MNEVSVRPLDVGSTACDFKSTVQRGMKGIEEDTNNIVARQMNTGREELRSSSREPSRDEPSTPQSQMNEFVELLRPREMCQIEDIRCMLRDCLIDVKKEVKVQLQELVHVLRGCGCELKERVSRAGANASSMLAVEQCSLHGILASSKRERKSTKSEGHLAAAVSEKDDIPWAYRLEYCLYESLETLEFLRQQNYRHSKEPWVSSIIDFSTNPLHATWSNNFRPTSFNVNLSNCERACGSEYSTQW